MIAKVQKKSFDICYQEILIKIIQILNLLNNVVLTNKIKII